MKTKRYCNQAHPKFNGIIGMNLWYMSNKFTVIKNRPTGVKGINHTIVRKKENKRNTTWGSRYNGLMYNINK